MNQFKKILLAAISIIAIITFAILAFSPQTMTRENSISVKATVTSVREGGLKDIVISLQGIRGIHYISKGHTHGLTAASLSKKLLNKEVTILYAKPPWFSKLSPMTDTRNITEVRLGKEIVYNNLK